MSNDNTLKLPLGMDGDEIIDDTGRTVAVVVQGGAHGDPNAYKLGAQIVRDCNAAPELRDTIDALLSAAGYIHAIDVSDANATPVPDDDPIDYLRRMRQSRDDMLAALRAIVEFCDDPDGSEKGESLALGLCRLLPAARAAIAKATGGGDRR